MSMQFVITGTRKSKPLVRTTCLWLVAAVGMAVAGCGQGSFKYGPDYPVKGKVLLADGKPLRSGRVVFVSSQTALSYAGPIGDDGKFRSETGRSCGCAGRGLQGAQSRSMRPACRKALASRRFCLSRPSIGTKMFPSWPPRSRPIRRMSSSSSSRTETGLSGARALRSLERSETRAMPTRALDDPVRPCPYP